jgi:hypothetical protein
MKRPHRASSLIVVLLIASCSTLPTRPSRFGGGLELTVSLSSDSGDPSHPITIHARVINTGRMTVYYPSGCTQYGLVVAVHAPDRANILTPCGECPLVVCPGCPEGVAPLRRGESLESVVTYSGTLLSCDGPYQGQAGRYAVEVRLPAILENRRDVSVSRDASFLWSTPSTR